MDYALLIMMLLVAGGIGTALLLDRDSPDDGDPVQPLAQPMPRPARHMAAETTETDLAADRDALAWFLAEDGDGPGILPKLAEAVPMASPPASAARPRPDPHDVEISLEDDPTPPRIEGFVPGGDKLEILYTPVTDARTGARLAPRLDIAPTPDGTGSLILLDTVIVAEVVGLPNLSPDSISLMPDGMGQRHGAAA